MKKIILLICSLWLFTQLPVCAQEYGPMLRAAMRFLGTPYVAHTLEVNEDECLVVNLNQVDCTTFVEYVLAAALSGKPVDEIPQEEFINNLRKVRYRDGHIDGYTSRLHYVADWINDNIRMGLIEDVTARHSPDTLVLSLSFMSANAGKYRQLKDAPDKVEIMKRYEQELTGQTVHWLPKDKLPAGGLPWIKNGDIIALMTSIDGLDVSHMGIAIYVNDKLHLLHASSAKKTVLIDQLPLNRYLNRGKKLTGIRVLRAKL